MGRLPFSLENEQLRKLPPGHWNTLGEGIAFPPSPESFLPLCEMEGVFWDFQGLGEGSLKKPRAVAVKGICPRG